MSRTPPLGGGNRGICPRDQERSWEAARADNTGVVEARVTTHSRTADLRRVSPRHRNADVVFRFARDSPLEGTGFELPVPRTTPGFWPISTRTTRRDRCRKTGVRIRQLLVCAALGREWWARRRSVLSVSDPRERAAREPAGADRAPSSPSSAPG